MVSEMVQMQNLEASLVIFWLQPHSIKTNVSLPSSKALWSLILKLGYTNPNAEILPKVKQLAI